MSAKPASVPWYESKESRGLSKGSVKYAELRNPVYINVDCKLLPPYRHVEWIGYILFLEAAYLSYTLRMSHKSTKTGILKAFFRAG